VLAPDDRALLLDALRPPGGTRLRRAVGTTFTLDLATALTVPLAFAGHSLKNKPDSILTMDGIRQSADLLDIFCQAGGIAGGRWPSDLIALLESVVHEIRRPRPGHLFHPKVWVAQYSDDAGIDRFRVLVLSRNLTADRGWDFIVRLDGEPSKTINHDNTGLVTFVAALPDMAKQQLTEERRNAIRALAERLRRVHWDLPQGASQVRFWPIGLPKTLRPNLDEMFRGYRHLVISPFVSAEGLDAVVRPVPKGSDVTVISRAEELDKLPTGSLNGWTVRVINPLAGLENSAAVEEELADTPRTVLSALHAKVIVVERNRGARAFFGSANATAAAFGGNVEFMCEFQGGPNSLGLVALLGPGGLSSLLEAYTPPSAPIVDEVEKAGRQLDAFLIDAAQLAYRVTVKSDDGRWRATITTDKAIPEPPVGVIVNIAPFNRLTEKTVVAGGKPVRVELPIRDGADLTPFLILRAQITVDKHAVERTAVVCAELIGGPSDRLDEILVRQIDTPEKFLRFLLLLLGLGELSLPTATDSAGTVAGNWGQADRLGIFELLVRALAIDPTAIDRLDEIVRRLSAHKGGTDVLPLGWSQLWATVIQARKLLLRKS